MALNAMLRSIDLRYNDRAFDARKHRTMLSCPSVPWFITKARRPDTKLTAPLGTLWRSAEYGAPGRGVSLVSRVPNGATVKHATGDLMTTGMPRSVGLSALRLEFSRSSK